MNSLEQTRLHAATELTHLLELRLSDDHQVGDTAPALDAVDAIADYTLHAFINRLDQTGFHNTPNLYRKTLDAPRAQNQDP